MPDPFRCGTGKLAQAQEKGCQVSEEIRSALQMQGYYMRKLKDLDRD